MITKLRKLGAVEFHAVEHEDCAFCEAARDMDRDGVIFLENEACEIRRCTRRTYNGAVVVDCEPATTASACGEVSAPFHAAELGPGWHVHCACPWCGERVYAHDDGRGVAHENPTCERFVNEIMAASRTHAAQLERLARDRREA